MARPGHRDRRAGPAGRGANQRWLPTARGWWRLFGRLRRRLLQQLCPTAIDQRWLRAALFVRFWRRVWQRVWRWRCGDITAQLEPGPARLPSFTAATRIHDPSSVLWLGRQHLAYGTFGTPTAAGRMGWRLRAGLFGVHSPFRGLGCASRLVAVELVILAAGCHLFQRLQK